MASWTIRDGSKTLKLTHSKNESDEGFKNDALLYYLELISYFQECLIILGKFSQLSLNLYCSILGFPELHLQVSNGPSQIFSWESHHPFSRDKGTARQATTLHDCCHEENASRHAVNYFILFYFFFTKFTRRQVVYNRTQRPLLGKLPNPTYTHPYIQRTATTPGTSCPTLFE